MIDMSGWSSIKAAAVADAVARVIAAGSGSAREYVPESPCEPPLVLQTRECGAMPNACGHAVPWPDHWRSR